MSLLSNEELDDLSREMVKGGKSVNWLASKIEAAVLEAQGKQEPVAWAYTINNSHSVFSAEKPPEDAYDEGSLHPLYAAPVVQPETKSAGYWRKCHDIAEATNVALRKQIAELIAATEQRNSDIL